MERETHADDAIQDAAAWRHQMLALQHSPPRQRRGCALSGGRAMKKNTPYTHSSETHTDVKVAVTTLHGRFWVVHYSVDGDASVQVRLDGPNVYLGHSKCSRFNTVDMPLAVFEGELLKLIKKYKSKGKRRLKPQ